MSSFVLFKNVLSNILVRPHNFLHILPANKSCLIVQTESQWLSSKEILSPISPPQTKSLSLVSPSVNYPQLSSVAHCLTQP